MAITEQQDLKVPGAPHSDSKVLLLPQWAERPPKGASMDTSETLNPVSHL